MSYHKYFCCAILFFLFTTLTFAQDFPIDKHSKSILGYFQMNSLGGNLYKDSKNNRITAFQKNISAVYFLFPGFATGTKSSLTRTVQGDNSEITWAAGPTATFFLKGRKKSEKISGTLYPFISGSVLYVYNKLKVQKLILTNQQLQKITVSSTKTGIGVSLGFGLIIMVTKSIGISSKGSYQIDNLSHKESSKSASGNRINILFGLSGFFYQPKNLQK